MHVMYAKIANHMFGNEIIALNVLNIMYKEIIQDEKIRRERNAQWVRNYQKWIT